MCDLYQGAAALISISLCHPGEMETTFMTMARTRILFLATPHPPSSDSQCRRSIDDCNLERRDGGSLPLPVCCLQPI